MALSPSQMTNIYSVDGEYEVTIPAEVTVTLYAIWKEDTSSDAAKSNSLLIEDEPPLATGTDAYNK